MGDAEANEPLRREIAGVLLGRDLSPEGFGRCPGEELHTNRTGPRDFVVKLDGAPTGYCVHDSCRERVEAFNRELRSRIGRAERGADFSQNERKEKRFLLRPGKPAQPTPKRPPHDPVVLAKFLAEKCPDPVSRERLREHSPAPVEPPQAQGAGTAERFLDALFRPGERVLVFSRQTSQGDYMREIGAGTFGLSQRPGVDPRPASIPKMGREGIWFLIQPVSGEWVPNKFLAGKSGRVDGVVNSAPATGRRHGGCVAEWRYALLESDTLPGGDWLRVLAALPVPVAAIYTSGGRSIHALARIDASSKEEWDSVRDELVPLVCTLGADGAALSAVRLSRLPGCWRAGKRGRDGRFEAFAQPRLQELIWLDPSPTPRPIIERLRP